MAYRKTRVVCTLLGVAMILAAVRPNLSVAQEFFAAPRDFVVDKACEAHNSIKKKSNPAALEVGKSYPGRGVNKKDGATHAFIRVGAESKWVDLSCGRFADGVAVPGAGAGAAAGGTGTGARSQQCLPFFDEASDTVNAGFGGTVDITPKPPQLNAFDDAINAACGAPGKIVGGDEFKAMFRSNTDVLERLKTYTGGKVFGDRAARTSTEDYLADLTEAWFAIAAFDHIFCGEPSAGGGKIGGLHFHGRYLQLQTNGNACRMNNFAQNEVVPGVIYTMGVIMKNASGRMVRDARKGYGLTLSGEDLFKVVTRAFSENPTASTGSTGCLLPVSDDGKDFKAVFVRRAAGIRTFYPDATPNGRGDKVNPPCASPVRLQN